MVTSLTRFTTGVLEVRLLLNLDPQKPGALPESGAEADEVQEKGAAIRRAAAVLLVSHFEGYLKQLAEDMTDTLNSGQIEARRIPRGLREIHVLPRLAEITSANDSVQRFALMKKLERIQPLWKDDAKPPRGTLSATVVTRQVTNGDSECIDNLFSLFGFRGEICAGDIDVRNSASGEDETHSIRGRLSDIVKCRNDIAHGDTDRRPTHDDLIRYIEFLEQLARRLERRSAEILQGFSVWDEAATSVG